MEIPKGYTLITEPEVKFFKFSDFNQVLTEVTKILSSLDKKYYPWLKIKMERRPPQARPNMKWYPGDRRTIIKLCEPRNSPQHDLVHDKELLVLNTDQLTSELIHQLQEHIYKIIFDDKGNYI